MVHFLVETGERVWMRIVLVLSESSCLSGAHTELPKIRDVMIVSHCNERRFLSKAGCCGDAV